MLVNSSFSRAGFVFGGLEHAAQPRRQARRRAAVRPRQLVEQLPRRPTGPAPGSMFILPRTRRHDAVALLDEREEQVFRHELGVPPRSASCCAASTASCAFSVYLFRFMALLRRSAPPALFVDCRAPRSAPVRRRIELGGNLEFHRRVQVARLVGLPTAGMPCRAAGRPAVAASAPAPAGATGDPPSVGTLTSPPSTAVVTGTGTARVQILPAPLELAVGQQGARADTDRLLSPPCAP